MRASRMLVVAVALIGVSAALAATSGVKVGTAIEVPGTATLNVGGDARTLSLSCAVAGNCSAGGWYVDGSDYHQAFVVSEKDGVWGQAIEVPGTADLNNNFARVSGVSCSRAGSCAAAGSYFDSFKRPQPFVVDEKNGVWGTAIEVPGAASLEGGPGYQAEVGAISCASPGNCAAGGYYTLASKGEQPLVVNEKHGVWGSAITVPGTAALNLSGVAEIASISCPAAGNCNAGGIYRDKHGRGQAFVVREKKWKWGKAIQVPGTSALNKGGGGGALVISLSCAGPLDCAAGGEYTDHSGHTQAFVADEKKGVWEKAIEVPGTAALNKGGNAAVVSVSCPTPGDCAAGGMYKDRSGRTQAFVVGEKNGKWGKAIEVPGTAALNVGTVAQVNSLSCATVGNCEAGGYYSDNSGRTQAFVAEERNGVWKKAIEEPGTASLNVAGLAMVLSVSCVRSGSCAAGGSYSDSPSLDQAYVTQP